MPSTQEVMENLVYQDDDKTTDMVMTMCLTNFGKKINQAWLDSKEEHPPSPYWAHLAAISCVGFMKELAQELRLAWEADIIAQLDEVLGRNNSRLDNELLRMTVESEELLHAKYSRSGDGTGLSSSGSP